MSGERQLLGDKSSLVSTQNPSSSTPLSSSPAEINKELKDKDNNHSAVPSLVPPTKMIHTITTKSGVEISINNEDYEKLRTCFSKRDDTGMLSRCLNSSFLDSASFNKKIAPDANELKTPLSDEQLTQLGKIITNRTPYTIRSYFTNRSLFTNKGTFISDVKSILPEPMSISTLIYTITSLNDEFIARSTADEKDLPSQHADFRESPFSLQIIELLQDGNTNYLRKAREIYSDEEIYFNLLNNFKIPIASELTKYSKLPHHISPTLEDKKDVPKDNKSSEQAGKNFANSFNSLESILTHQYSLLGSLAGEIRNLEECQKNYSPEHKQLPEMDQEFLTLSENLVKKSKEMFKVMKEDLRRDPMPLTCMMRIASVVYETKDKKNQEDMHNYALTLLKILKTTYDKHESEEGIISGDDLALFIENARLLDNLFKFNKIHQDTLNKLDEEDKQTLQKLQELKQQDEKADRQQSSIIDEQEKLNTILKKNLQYRKLWSEIKEQGWKLAKDFNFTNCEKMSLLSDVLQHAIEIINSPNNNIKIGNYNSYRDKNQEALRQPLELSLLVNNINLLLPNNGQAESKNYTTQGTIKSTMSSSNSNALSSQQPNQSRLRSLWNGIKDWHAKLSPLGKIALYIGLFLLLGGLIIATGGFGAIAPAAVAAAPAAITLAQGLAITIGLGLTYLATVTHQYFKPWFKNLPKWGKAAFCLLSVIGIAADLLTTGGLITLSTASIMIAPSVVTTATSSTQWLLGAQATATSVKMVQAASKQGDSVRGGSAVSILRETGITTNSLAERKQDTLPTQKDSIQPVSKTPGVSVLRQLEETRDCRTEYVSETPGVSVSSKKS